MRAPRWLLATTAVVAGGGLIGLLTYTVYCKVLTSSVNAGKRTMLQTSTAAPPEEVLPTSPKIELPVELNHSTEEREMAMQLLQVLKKNANTAFQEGRHEDAMRGYQDCIEVTSALGASDAEAVITEQIVRANIVMACICLHEYDTARAVATMLLQDPAVDLPDDIKVKVLYRRGRASQALGDRAAALADLQAALHFSKGQQNPPLEKEIALLQSGNLDGGKPKRQEGSKGTLRGR